MKIKTREAVWEQVVDALKELLADRGEEPEGIRPTTMLNADLGIASIDAMHLMIMLEDRMGTSFNFQELVIRDGEYVQDLSVGDVQDFVAGSVNIAKS